MLLHDLLDDAAAAAPDTPALVYGGSTHTFTELRDRVRALAGAVQARTAPGARIAILGENSDAYVEWLYAVPEAGRVLVLLNYRLHPREWVVMLRRAGVTMLVGERGLLDAIAPHLGETTVAEVVALDTPKGDEADHEALVAADQPCSPATDEHATAWLIFTSGTTGTPKGVTLTHHSLLAAARNTALGRPVAPDDVYAYPFPLCHVAAYNVLVMHLHARPVVVLRRFTTEAFRDACTRHHVTNASLAPTMLAMLLDDPALDDADLASLRQVAYGSSAIPVEVLRRAMARLHCDFAQGYGMTELSGNAVFLDGDDHRRAVGPDPHLLVAAGRPGPLAEVRVVDDELRDLPTGTAGEILVRGEQVAPGYWEDPDATAAARTPDGWLRTGDIGRLDDEGYLYVVDRKKDLIVTGGENVASREVEDVLHRHPGVADVAVVGVPDPRWGEAVCAVVVPRADAAPTEEELVALSREHLAGYKKPRHVVFVDALPRNASGKVLKQELREDLTRRLRDPDAPDRSPGGRRQDG